MAYLSGNGGAVSVASMDIALTDFDVEVTAKYAEGRAAGDPYIQRTKVSKDYTINIKGHVIDGSQQALEAAVGTDCAFVCNEGDGGTSFSGTGAFSRVKRTLNIDNLLVVECELMCSDATANFIGASG